MRPAVALVVLGTAAVAVLAWWLVRDEAPQSPPVEREAPAAIGDGEPAPSAPSPEPDRTLAMPEGDLTIAVRVTDRVSGERVRGCVVELWKLASGSAAARKRDVATSAFGGAIEFTGLAAGVYELRVQDAVHVGEPATVELTSILPNGQAELLVDRK